MVTISVTTTANDGRKVCLTGKQAVAIETMTNTRKGGCGAVKGYRPSSRWIVPPVQDIQLITHFSTAKLYERRLKALADIEFGDLTFSPIADRIKEDKKLSKMTISEWEEIFNSRKAMMMESLQKTLDGDRSDAHRQAHDRCYAHIGDVKVHLVTEDGIKEDGKKGKVPVTDDDGTVYVESIMVPYLELNVIERKAGERKPKPKSGAPVLVGNLIEKCLNKRSVIYKTLSLKEDNFESFKVDHQKFLPEHVASFGDLLNS